jgi:Arc/MetJ-type ribon-helix-helix transcriptional regulator
MKQKLSVTIDEEKIELVEEILKQGLFRNKSHVLEFALSKFLEEKQNQEDLE